jgi:multidrug resistance efflux pump
MEMTGRQYEEFVINKDELNEKQAELVKELKAASQMVDLATRHVEDAEVCLTITLDIKKLIPVQLDKTTAQRRREQCLANKNHWYEKHEHYQAELRGLEAEAEKARTKVAVRSPPSAPKKHSNAMH